MSDCEEYGEFQYDDDSDYDMEGEDPDDAAIEQANKLDFANDDENNGKLDEALRKYKVVIQLVDDGEKTPASNRKKFQALERIVIVTLKLGLRDEVVDSYKRLLGALEMVPQNDGFNAINNVQKEVSHKDVHEAEFIYKLTLSAVNAAPEDAQSSICFNTLIKLANLYVEKEMALSRNAQIRKRGNLDLSEKAATPVSHHPLSREETNDRAEARKIITSLYEKCSCDPSGAPMKTGNADDASLKSSRLQIYAVDIQLCRVVGNLIRLKSIYVRAYALLAESILLPAYNAATIKEAGGRIKMYERKWDEANQAFFEAFKKYQETSAGALAKSCLKYAVVANMLSGSTINPFDSCEAKALLDDPEIVLFRDLRSLVDLRDIRGIIQLMESPAFLLDEVLAPLLDDVMARVRCDEILRLVVPYKRIALEFVAQMVELWSADEAASLLSKMILQGRLKGVIDQATGYLILDGCEAEQDVLRGLLTTSDLVVRSKKDGVVANDGKTTVGVPYDRGGFTDSLDEESTKLSTSWTQTISIP